MALLCSFPLFGVLGVALVAVVWCQQFVNFPNGPLPSVQRPTINNNNNHIAQPQIPATNNQFPGPQFPNLQSQQGSQFESGQPQLGPLTNTGPSQGHPAHAIVAGSSIAFMMRRGLRSSQTNQNGAYVSYQQEVTKVNANINAASGIFLVQVPGIYSFSISGIGATNSAFRIILRKNSDVIALIFGGQSQMASDSTVVSANVGDYIYPTVEGSIADSSFSGYIVAMVEDKTNQQTKTTSTAFPGDIFGNPFGPYSGNGNNGFSNNNNNLNPFTNQNDMFSNNRPMGLYPGFQNNNGPSRTFNNTRVATSSDHNDTSHNDPLPIDQTTIDTASSTVMSTPIHLTTETQENNDLQME